MGYFCSSTIGSLIFYDKTEVIIIVKVLQNSEIITINLSEKSFIDVNFILRLVIFIAYN